MGLPEHFIKSFPELCSAAAGGGGAVMAISASLWGPGGGGAPVPPGAPRRDKERSDIHVHVSPVVWKMLGFTFSHGAAQELLGVTQPKDGLRSSGQSLCPLLPSLHIIKSRFSLGKLMDGSSRSWEQDELCTVWCFGGSWHVPFTASPTCLH